MTDDPGVRTDLQPADDSRVSTELSVDEAQAIIAGGVMPVPEVEQVTLQNGLGRVLAETIFSPIDVPAYDNAAMDGYAFCSGDLQADRPACLQLIGTVSAGDSWSRVVGRNECLRIMTGARMPAGCDIVIARERVQPSAESYICFDSSAVSPGDNCRRAGEDLPAGGVALAAGTLIQPAHLGVIASLGIGNMTVRRRVRVAFFSTGNELRSIGDPIDPGCIYDSNRYTLLGMLMRLGCEPIDMGIVKDQPEALETAFRSACVSADVVISSGGMSVGVADHVQMVMARLGEVAHWTLRMRPGRPLAFGHLHTDAGTTCVFGLPGNPVAVMAAFYFLVRPALRKMMGITDSSSPAQMFKAMAVAGIAKRSGRLEYQRGILSPDGNGAPQVRLTGAQGSGMLSSMAQANCIVVLGAAQGDIASGELVDIVPFDGLI